MGCDVKGGGGSSSSSSPEFKRKLLDISAAVGTSSKFVVEINNFKTSDLKVSWTHNDLLVTNSSHTSLLQEEGGIFTLLITDLTPEDGGTWTCVAVNASGTKSSAATLNLQIPKIYRAPAFVAGLRGALWDNGTLTLECDVLGTPTPVLRWYRDGKPLSPGADLSIKYHCKESKSFMGLFACEATNCMGSQATFSKVYARNFASYLKSCGYDILTLKKKGGKVTKRVISLNVKKEDEDSGIGLVADEGITPKNKSRK